MTEITEKSEAIPRTLARFVAHWGEMGEAWGVNRSVAQIHALLYVSERPLSAEEISESLRLARSNVSNSLRELLSWSLVRRVPVLGDRRDYFEAEGDMLEMVRRIAAGRKVREIDPAITVLRACVVEAGRDKGVSPVVRKRLEDMLSFTVGVGKSFDEIMALPAPVLGKLIKMGGAVARFVAGTKGRRSSKR
jgi:DNA-binding transcriptional regulator GbsR (MarR family)